MGKWKNGDRVRLGNEHYTKGDANREVHFHGTDVRTPARDDAVVKLSLSGPIYGVVLYPALREPDADDEMVDVVIEGHADKGVALGWYDDSWEPAPEYCPSDETRVLVAQQIVLRAALGGGR